MWLVALWLAALVVPAVGSDAAAQGWNAPRAFCDPCGRDVNSPPVLAVNDSGQAVVAWGRDELLVAERRGSARFSPAVSMSRGKRIGGRVRVAIGADGTRAVAWREGQNAADLVVRVRPPSGRWTPAKRFEGSSFDVAVSRDGTTYLVTNPGAVLVRELRARGRWTAPVQISAPEAPMPLGGAVTLELVIRIGGGGHVLVAWTVQEGFPRATYPRFGSAYRAPRGSWQPAEVAVADPDPLTDHEPAIALDRAGNALLTWRGADGRLRSVHRRALDGWQARQDVAAVKRDVLSAPADVELDAAGNAVVSFVGPQGPGGSVNVARRSATSGVWSAPRRVSSDRWGPLDLAIAVGGDGTGQVVWQQRRGVRGQGIGTLSAPVSSTSGTIGRAGLIVPAILTRRTVGAVRAAASRAGVVTVVWQQPSLRANPTPARAEVAYLTARRPADEL